MADVLLVTRRLSDEKLRAWLIEAKRVFLATGPLAQKEEAHNG